jgi:hypothetical protein
MEVRAAPPREKRKRRSRVEEKGRLGTAPYGGSKQRDAEHDAPPSRLKKNAFLYQRRFKCSLMYEAILRALPPP